VNRRRGLFIQIKPEIVVPPEDLNPLGKKGIAETFVARGMKEGIVGGRSSRSTPA
jgi:hypothetical protein